MKEGNTVLVVGLGALGSRVLGILSRTPGLWEWIRIVAGDVNEDKGQRTVNTAVWTARQLGYHPNVEFVRLDLLDTESTAGILKRYDPDLILQCGTLQSWWVRDYLPVAERKKLENAGLGPWTPMHLTLPYNLMRAVDNAGVSPYVINASFPDVVCPALGKVGLAPTVGIGNMSLLVPLVEMLTSRELGVPTRDVTVFMVGAHYLDERVELYGNTNGAPYYLRILVNGEDVTARIDPNQKLRHEGLDFPRIVEDPREATDPVAASAVAIVRAILQDTREIVHAPGPRGLPGGYPVRLGREIVEVVLPEGISLEQAIRINEEDNRFDGIESIEDDGTIVITEESSEVMRDILNFEVREFSIRDTEEVASALGRSFRSYGERIGLPDFALDAIYTGKGATHASQ